MFHIILSRDAEQDLIGLRKFDQQRIRDAMRRQLTMQADEEARNRKKLRPNKLAQWELRVGKYRVFYDVDSEEALVLIVAIGYKEHEQLFFEGEEPEL